MSEEGSGRVQTVKETLLFLKYLALEAIFFFFFPKRRLLSPEVKY